MDDIAPLERLQPCLLDRLTDDEPTKKEESRSQRVVSIQRYRKGVMRDLVWLFNSSAHLPIEGKKGFRIDDFPEAARSVINYGTRQLFGLTAPDMNGLEQELQDAICAFEPRILKNSLVVKAEMDRQVVSFELSGELWANPLPEKLFIKTKIDIEAGATPLTET
jgi:type VI secretion system protein ImpF